MRLKWIAIIEGLKLIRDVYNEVRKRRRVEKKIKIKRGEQWENFYL